LYEREKNMEFIEKSEAEIGKHKDQIVTEFASDQATHLLGGL